ncbi:hypothetical protein TNCV_162801 [Trichonephila clavipes]|nr:hypothetical protein TNCV_162801 [Trichonephila clavipes]
MDVCKCIAPLRHGGTQNSSQAASPFVRLVEGEESPNYGKQRPFEVQSSKNIIDVDSDNENGKNNRVPVLTSSEMRNIMKTPVMVDKDILEFVQSSKNIFYADSEDGNEMNNAASVTTSSEMRSVMKNSNDEREMNNAAPVPTSSEMMNVVKSMRSYLDAHSVSNLYGTFPLKFLGVFLGIINSRIFPINSKRTATAGSDVVQSGRPIFDDFFQHLWPYIGNNTANVVFQMVKRLWLIRIDQ